MFSDLTNLVIMSDRFQARQTAPLNRIEAYWRGLSGGQIPLRSQVDAGSIESDLEYAFIAQRIAPGMAKLRVAGSHLNDLMGMDTSGMPLSALMAPSARVDLSQALTHFFRHPGITRIKLKGETGIGKPAISGEMMLAPLCSDPGEFDRVLGALITSGRIGRTPRRMSITGVSHVPMADLDLPEPGPAPMGELAEPASVFEHKSKSARDPEPQKKHPYLRLIVSNDD